MNIFDRMGRMADQFLDKFDAWLESRVTLTTSASPEDSRGVKVIKVIKGTDQITVKVEVPGRSPEDIVVLLKPFGVLQVIDKIPEAHVKIPIQTLAGIRLEDITATVKHGMLTITISRPSSEYAQTGRVPVTEG